MIRLYYTPELIADYCYENNLNVDQVHSLIKIIYDEEFIFIDSYYKYRKEMFNLKLMSYLYYLTKKEEYLENKYIKEFSDNFNVSSTAFKDIYTLEYYFMKIRLNYLFNIERNKRIQYSTFLKKFANKRKSDEFIRYVYDCMLFYHITVNHYEKEVDLNVSDIGDTITFKVMV